MTLIYDPNEFPTLITYPQEMIEEAVEKLKVTQGLTQQQALVNLEQDLSEIEARSTG